VGRKDKSNKARPEPKVRLVFRGWAGDQIKFAEKAEVAVNTLAQVLPMLAERHAKALSSHALSMIEIEFVDEPDASQRFFRFGPDPSGMVCPIEVNLQDQAAREEALERWGKVQ